MKKIFLPNLFILLVILPSFSFAQKTKASFDDQKNILTLSEINILPENATYSATLRQVNPQEFVLELDTLTLVNSSSIYYQPTQQILHIPKLTLGDITYQQVKMALIADSDPPRFRLMAAEPDKNAIRLVPATVETKPVPASGDAADDPAIWVHPKDTALSTVIGTQKQGGIGVYDLAGQEIQYLKDGNMNNVDLRYHFPLGDKQVTLITASNRSNDSIAVYTINPNSRLLEPIAARTLSVGLKHTAYGLCMYHSKQSGKYYVFINDKSGAVEQWELFDNGSGLVDAALVRTLKVNSQVEGCVADDLLGYFYLGEEKQGIWKFAAEPDAGNEKTLIDSTNKKTGNLIAEIEGLTIYYLNETEGYLIASNQGNDSFTIHNRAGDNEFIGRFQIIANEKLNIDQVYDTDGIDVVNVPLGNIFPYGLFVVQDGENIDPDENQNFKLVPWESIAQAFGLKIDNTYQIR